MNDQDVEFKEPPMFVSLVMVVIALTGFTVFAAIRSIVFIARQADRLYHHLVEWQHQNQYRPEQDNANQTRKP